jgi:[acyl-carrier-protein] S-malonyltransferase
MQGAAESLKAELESVAVSAPRVPVWHNADVETHDAPAEIRASLSRQLWQPVRWTRTIEVLVDRGTEHFVECGPGRVLAGLNKRIARNAAFTVLDSREAMDQLMEEQMEAGS